VEQKREKTEEKSLGALGSAGACLLETNYGVLQSRMAADYGLFGRSIMAFHALSHTATLKAWEGM
jgi:hypothetical protein